MRLIAAASLLLLARPDFAQDICRLYLANQSDASSGFLLSLNSSAVSNGKCPLSGAALRLTVGDGNSLHHVDVPFNWQTGFVYTAQAVITAGGPQQLTINGQSAGSLQGEFKPSGAIFAGSSVADSGNASEAFIVTQISVRVTNGANTLNIAPNGPNPLPVPLVLLSGGPVPWKTTFTVNPAQPTTVTATFRFDTATSNPHQFDPYIDPYGQPISATWQGKISADADLTAAAAAEQTWLTNNGPILGFDQFGGSTVAGWTDSATGYYHVARLNGRWFLISPLGNPTFYLGITAIGQGVTPITGREAMFQLPPQTGQFAQAYSLNQYNDSQNTTYYSHSIANRIRKYGSSWQATGDALMQRRLASWGFFGGGKFGSFPEGLPITPILAQGGAPGVRNAVPGGHPDVFDTTIAAQLKSALAKQMGTDITNPYIVGWSVGNEVDEIVTISEVQAILALGASSPAKQALVVHALNAPPYNGSIDALATAWNISATTLAGVYASKPTPPASDLKALRLFYENAYYSALYQSVKSIDPNHLYFGSWVPSGNTDDWAIAAANSDVVGFDDFSPGALDPTLLAQFAATNKPVMLGAFGIPCDYGGARGFGWSQYTSSQTLSDSDSGDAYAARIASAAANSYVVGAELFAYYDESVTGRGNTDGNGNISDALTLGEDFAFGLLDVADEPKYDFVNKVRAANIAALNSLGLLGAAPTLTSAPANGATYLAGGLVPGSWAQVKGANLSDVERTWQASDFTGLGNHLPTDLTGTQVLVNGTAAAVYYISPTQVSFQVPAGISDSATVQVTRHGQASNTQPAQAVASAPGIFPVIVNGINYAAAVFLDGKIAGSPMIGSAFRNAVPGDVVQLFATGLAASAAGTVTSTAPLSGVTVTIGDVTVPVSFAALVGAGEFQINFSIPQSFAAKPAAVYPISIAVNGVSSPPSINSSPPGPVVIPIQPH